MSKQHYFENAMHKVNENDFDSAIELFSKALLEDANNQSIYYNRGVAFLNLEKIDLAIFDFNKLIDLDPNNAFNYSCRAFAKARSKDKKGAILDYEKAIELDPDNPITYNNMGLVQEEIGWMDQAKKSFNQSDDLRKKEQNTFGKAPLKSIDSKTLRSEEAILNSASEIDILHSPSKSDVAKKIFTDKNTFKEFLGFVKNGFKLKE